MTARRALPDMLAACLLAAAIFVAFGHAFLNYDTFYALVWGDDLAHGRTPQYDVPVHPTTHPLAVALGAAASLFGDSAEDVMLAVGFLALGALGVGLFRLGQALYAWPVGVLAAAIVLTRVPVLNYGVRGYVDLWTLALIVWAAVLEARAPRRGAAVLALLALAGLLRPEAWLIGVAYLAWLAAGGVRGWRLLRLAGLAAVAPALWFLSDGLITGDALWSLHGTSDVAKELERKTGLGNVPGTAPRRLGEILRAPELAAAAIGLALGLAWFRRRSLIPLGLLLLNGVAFLVFAVAGLSLLGRYLFLGACMLALFASLAALGWTSLDEGDRRRPGWRVGGLALIFVFGLFFPVQLGRLGDLRSDIADRDRVQADLLSLVRQEPAERALRRCGTLYVPNHRPVPSLAYWTETPPERIVSAQLEHPRPDGLFLAPANDEVERLSLLDPKDPKRFEAEVPSSYEVAARNRSWVLYEGC